MFAIEIKDAPDIVHNVTIDDVDYKLRLMYNINGFWVLHLWDYNENPLITNIKVVPNFPLLMNKHCFDVPKGEFVVVSKDEQVDRNSFNDGRATLVYITEQECNIIKGGYYAV